MSYGTDYLDIPSLTRQTGGKGNKMPNKTLTNEAKTKSYRKTRGEHYKDIVIAVLVTAVIGFVAGMHFSNSQHAQTEQAVKAAVTVQAPVKK